MMILQLIPEISNSGGIPTIALPLGFVIFVSMVKDFLEDWKRTIQDNMENNCKAIGVPIQRTKEALLNKQFSQF